MNFPATIESEESLNEVLTQPQPGLVQAIKQVASPLLVLGANGKMGLTLCALARRAALAACHDLTVIAVSRFPDDQPRSWLAERGVESLRCDLMDRASVEKLPDTTNLVYLVGFKFGTHQNPSMTWAVNTLVPSRVAERYPCARIVALSTGNVYPLVPVSSGGATEELPPAPVGEYAQAALARERIFEFYSRQRGTPMTLLRLNYAVELRYGVLVDIAEKVWSGGLIDLGNGYLNCVWQGDANDTILRSFPLVTSPPAVYNLTGAGLISVREVANQFAVRMGRPAQFVNEESTTSLLSNSGRLCQRLGSPTMPLARIIDWTAAWIARGGRTLGKPTHFEVRTGAY